MATIYELNEEYLNLLELLEDPDVEATEIQEQLALMQDDFERKMESYCKIRIELESKEEAIEREIKRLIRKKDTVKNNKDNIQRAIKDSMLTLGKKKMDLGSFKLSIRENAPSVKIDDETRIPTEFTVTKTTISVDKKALGNYLKNLQEENKYCDFAHLEKSKSLTIK